MKDDYNRMLRVLSHDTAKPAVFKTWSTESINVGDGVILIRPVAVVEYADGSVDYVPADSIKFERCDPIQEPQ